MDLMRRMGQEDALRADPKAVMLELVHNSHLMVQATQALVRGLEEENLGGIGKYIDVRLPDGETVRVPDHKGQLAEARMRLMGEWMDRATRISALAIRAGLETRLVELQEAQARQMATLLQRFVRNLGSKLSLSPDQQQAALELIVQEVRLLGNAAEG